MKKLQRVISIIMAAFLFTSLIIPASHISAIAQDYSNAEYLVYPPKVNDVTAPWGWTGMLEWYKAATGKGITLDFIKTSCWMRHTINYQRPVAVDGLHVVLDNSSVTRAGYFRFSLTNGSMPDVSTGNPPFSLRAYLEGSGKTNLYYTTSTGQYTLAENNADSAAMGTFMNGKWEIKLDKNSDGSYNLLFAGKTFIIPKVRMDDALASGLNFNSAYFTIGDVNTAQTSKWKFDVQSIHGGESTPYDNVSMNDINSIEGAIADINNIGTISTSSGTIISSARSNYDSIDPQYQIFVNNYEILTVAEKRYNRLISDTVDIDQNVYESTTDTIGPNKYWSTNSVDWMEASSGMGTTLKFVDTSVHNVGLTVKTKVALDGVDISFNNLSCNTNGGNFSLIFAEFNQTDHTSPAKLIWLDFSIGDLRSTVTVNAPGMNPGKVIIDSSFIKKSELSGRWSVRIDLNDDNSYTLSVGDVSGTIPASYVAAAVEEGLNLSASNITFGMRSYGGAANLNVDVISVHGGERPCFSSVSSSDASKIQPAIELINNIGNVSFISKNAIKTAREAVDSLPVSLRGLIRNYELLTNAEALYANIALDLDDAQKVIIMIDSIGSTINIDSKDKITIALRAYNDLFPRKREYVTNYNKLLLAKADYEKIDTKADFETWMFQLYSTGTYNNGNIDSNGNYVRTPNEGDNIYLLLINIIILLLSGSLIAKLYLNHYNLASRLKN